MIKFKRCGEIQGKKKIHKHKHRRVHHQVFHCIVIFHLRLRLQSILIHIQRIQRQVLPQQAHIQHCHRTIDHRSHRYGEEKTFLRNVSFGFIRRLQQELNHRQRILPDMIRWLLLRITQFRLNEMLA